MTTPCIICRREEHGSRRSFLKTAIGGLPWLSLLGQHLASRAHAAEAGDTVQSIIVLWMAGGPSQLETFDPHAGKTIAAGTPAIETPVAGIQLASGLPLLAERLPHLCLIRSMVSREGDHERGTYHLKTGYRPDPTIAHPAIGAIVCHQLPEGKAEIPRHVSILPNQWPARGGFLGSRFDAFIVGDPSQPIPDVRSGVSEDRLSRRLSSLDVVEKAFSNQRSQDLAERTQHQLNVQKALTMMNSEQLDAFSVQKTSRKTLEAFGDNPFGRGCLAALQLVQTGVRCVEVTLDGFDTHVNNHELHRPLVETLDKAYSALIDGLIERDLLHKTVVVCGGEFGRTPQMNPAGGRDHWPHGFSYAIAGGPFRKGHVHGATDPDGSQKVTDPVEVPDLHATLLHALQIDPTVELWSEAGRPTALSKGKILKSLLQDA